MEVLFVRIVLGYDAAAKTDHLLNLQSIYRNESLKVNACDIHVL